MIKSAYDTLTPTLGMYSDDKKWTPCNTKSTKVRKSAVRSLERVRSRIASRSICLLDSYPISRSREASGREGWLSEVIERGIVLYCIVLYNTVLYPPGM